MITITKELIEKINLILDRGLSIGLGKQGKQVCVEAAICEALNLPHGDDPKCVAESVRQYKIRLNDASWSSPKARAEGMRKLAVAQLGSLGVVNDREFSSKLAEATIRKLIPKLFREIWRDGRMEEVVSRCKVEGSKDAATNAADAANAANAAAYAAYAATNAADAAYAATNAADAAYAAAYAANAAYAATASAYAAYAAAYAATASANAAAYAVYATNAYASADTYLILSAQLALDILIELKSPGVAFLPKE